MLEGTLLYLSIYSTHHPRTSSAWQYQKGRVDLSWFPEEVFEWVQFSTSSRGENASSELPVPSLEYAPISRTISSINHSTPCMDAPSPSLQSPDHVEFSMSYRRETFIDVVEDVREVYKNRFGT